MENEINLVDYFSNKMDEQLDNDKKIIQTLEVINKELKHDNDLAEGRKVCSLCFEEIIEDDYIEDNVIDDPTTYGLCHRCCYEEAEESRLS